MRNDQNPPKHLLLRLFNILFILGIGVVAAVIIMISIIYPKLPSMDDLRNYQPKLPLQVYSDDGALLGQFGQEHRIYISINNTPKLLINAILAAEDERFYQHGGIDYFGVIRAVGLNLASGHIQSGASTITMQVARNFFLSSQKTFWRKFNEVLLAYKIEKSLSKDQILELYINQIYLGQRAYGFAEAAITYFGKPLDQLSIAEYAILAGLPKAPSAYNPVVNKSRSKERELYVLSRMRSLKFISDAEYNRAVEQKITIIKGSIKDITDSGGYIAEMVRQMLYAKYGDSIYTIGYKVYTTINSKMQQAAYISLRNGLLQYNDLHGYNGTEETLDLGDETSDVNQVITEAFNGIVDFGDLLAAIVIDANENMVKARLRNGNTIEFHGHDLDFVRQYLAVSSSKGIKRGAVIRVRNVNGKWSITQVPTIEGGIVALDPNDGSIKALIGGFDFTKNNYNHITQAMRQPGSSFKPFIYSAALDKGFNANSIIDDSEICFPSGGDGGGSWCPHNDDDSFVGPVTLRQALTLSMNVVTVKILNQISPQYAIDYVSRFGFNKSQFQPYLTMALGANEVTPLQMAEAYAVFANGGYLIAPYFVKVITDNKGNVIAKTAPINIHSIPPVIDPRNSYIMNSILQDVVRYGTGARAYRELHRNDMAGKTGTTTDAKDVWFDGYTPNLVAITWVGFDQPKTLGAHAFGATIALPIWINFMQQVLPSIPQSIIPMPSGIIVKPHSTWRGNDEYIYSSSNSITNSISESATPNTSVEFNKNNGEQITPVNSSSPSTSSLPNEEQHANNMATSNESALDEIINNVQQ